MSIIGRPGQQQLDHSGDFGVVVMIWSPGYDSIMAWEHRRSGIWSASWIEETCLRLLGGHVKQHFSLHRFGFVGYARLSGSTAETKLTEFGEKFGQLWREKQQSVALPDWSGIVITCPYQRAAEQVVDLEQRLLTLAEQGALPTTPSQLHHYDVDDFCQEFSVPPAAWWPHRQAVPE